MQEDERGLIIDAIDYIDAIEGLIHWEFPINFCFPF